MYIAQFNFLDFFCFQYVQNDWNSNFLFAASFFAGCDPGQITRCTNDSNQDRKLNW